MKKSFLFAVTTLFFCSQFLSIFGQEPKLDLWKQFTSIDRFNAAADARSEELIFRLLQYNAPYGGSYHETYLNNTGKSVSVRVTPFARQAGRYAVLDETQTHDIEQKLSSLALLTIPHDVKPVNGKLYSALIIKDGQTFKRFNFIGQIPTQLQDVLNSLNEAYDIADKKEIEETVKQGELLQQKYGNWLESPGIIRPTSSGESSLKNSNAVLLYANGLMQPVDENQRTEIPLYYALVFYPEGRIVGGAGAGGRSDDPISSNGISWALSDGYKREKELILKYDAINGTVSIKDSIFYLSGGNLFVVRIGRDWVPAIEQLPVNLDAPADKNHAITLFRKELNDESLEIR